MVASLVPVEAHKDVFVKVAPSMGDDPPSCHVPELGTQAANMLG